MDEPQFIKSPDGEDLVVINRKDYDNLIEALAEADLAQGEADLLPAEVSAMLLDGHRRLRAIRKWRGLRVEELASKSGVDENTINQVERGGPGPTPAQVAKLATALDVPVSWLD